MSEIDFTTNREIYAISQKQDELSYNDRAEIEDFVRGKISEQSLNKIKTYVDWDDSNLKIMLTNKELANHYYKIGNVEEMGYYAFSFINALCNIHIAEEFGLALNITNAEKQEKELNKYYEIAMKSPNYRALADHTFSSWQRLRNIQQSVNTINQALGGTSLPDHQ